MTRRWHAGRALAVVLLLALGVTAPPHAAVHAEAVGGRTFYVSSTGNDANDGQDPAAPWKSLGKVNSVVFQPGDTILFDGSSTWTGQLRPQGSGIKGNPIVIGRYGAGDRRPLIQGNGILPALSGSSPTVTVDETAGTDYGYLATVMLKNQQYWEINDLEVTNFSTDLQRIKTYTDTSGTTTAVRERIPSKYGILVLAVDSGINEHIYIKNTFVHDVNAYPGTSSSDSAGIGRGGVVFLIRGNQVPTWWNDVKILDNTIGIADQNTAEPNVTHYGVSFLSTWQRNGKSGYGMFAHESGIPAAEMSGTLKASTNLLFRGNSFFDVGNAVIQPSGYENAVIEHNVSAVSNSGKNGNVPFWWQYGKHTTVHYNEVFGTGASTSKEDSQAFDADIGAENSVVRYNYTHDNPSGAMFICPVGTSYHTDYAYNVSVNDGSGNNSHGGGAAVAVACGSDTAGSTLRVFNNDIFIGEGQTGYVANAWEARTVKNFQLENNAIYNSGSSRGYETRANQLVVADNNYYGGSGVDAVTHPSDQHPVLGDIGIPGLPTTLQRTMAQSTGWDKLDSYVPGPASVLAGAGKVIPDNGGLDVWGNEVSPFGKPSVGATEIGSTPAVPSGYSVLDFSDAPSPLAGETYQGVAFSSSAWVATGEGLAVSAVAPESVRNRIVVPAGMSLVGFRAKTVGAGKVTVASGVTTQDFYLSSANNYYALKTATASPDVFITVSAPEGARTVTLDDLVLAPTASTAQNVALNKPVQQSSGGNPAARGNDGSTATTAGNSGTFPYVWHVDLGAEFDVSRIETAWPSLKQVAGCTSDCAEAVKDWRYKLQWSDSSTGWNDPTSAAWNTIVDYTAAGSSPFDTPESSFEQPVATDVQARHLRIVVTGTPPLRSGAWVTLGELRAFGTPSESLVDVAVSGVPQQNRGSRPATNALDGDATTTAGNTGTFPYIWEIDLGAPYPLKKIETVWPSLKTTDGGTTEAVKNWPYKIQYASDPAGWDVAGAAGWTSVVDYTDGSSPFDTPESSFVQTVDADVTARYLRIVVTGPPPARSGAWAVLAEFRALADASTVVTSTGADTDDLAWGKPVQPEPATALTDQDPETTWSAGSAVVDLGLVYDLDRLTLRYGAQGGQATVEASVDGRSWTDTWSVSGSAGVTVTSSQGARARYLRVSSGADLASVAAYGSEAPRAPKTVLVVGAHPDDEALLGGGVIKRSLDQGDSVYALIATMGDYNGKTAGQNRMKESLNAMARLGLPADRVIFLGYGDNGGLEQYPSQHFEDSLLHDLYLEVDPNKVHTSRAGQTATYGGVRDSYHKARTGSEAAYTRAGFVGDLESAIQTIRPDEIYTTGTADLHPDHSYLGLFTGEAIVNVRKSDPSFDPAVFETTIHSPAGDSASAADTRRWPAWQNEQEGVVPHLSPQGFDQQTSLRWNDRVALSVPESMRVSPFAHNLKDQALRLYTSQYYGYIGAFAKADEVFWQRDYSGIGYLAEVSASSEKPAPAGAVDSSADQSASKVVDGVRDGYSTSMSSSGTTSHVRYPHGEWASDGETVGAWLRLAWRQPYAVDQVRLYDRPNEADQIVAAHLEFSDGSRVEIGELPDNGRGLTVSFTSRTVTWVRLVVDQVSASTTDVGLAELEVLGEVRGRMLPSEAAAAVPPRGPTAGKARQR